MNEVVAISYNQNYLAFSFAIAVIGSFVGLMASRHILGADGKIQWIHAFSAGAAIGGVGVWSMHFIGMLALKIDLASGYAMIETLISLIAAIVVTMFALAHVAKAPKETARLLQAGFALGLGVVVMHYLGMFGMRFNGVFAWNWGLVAASVVIAMVAATAALWLAFRMNSLSSRLLAALVMGIAVCAMHYTGMAAADIVCTTPNRSALPVGWDVVASFRLPMLVIMLSFGLLLIILLDQLYYSFSQRDQQQTAY
jgi:NO-binding membrane sensor protein with MHYT domain